MELSTAGGGSAPTPSATWPWLDRFGNLVLLAICLVTLSSFGVAKRVGDGSEYYAMLFSLADTHRPFATAPSWSVYEHHVAVHPESRFVPEMASRYRAFTNRRGETDFPHFWLYSLWVVPFLWISRLFRLDAGYAFTLAHLCVFVLTAKLARRLHPMGMLAVIAAVACSPALWQINKAHPEFITVNLSILAFAALPARPLWAALLFSLLSAQNPPFALAAILVSMFWVLPDLARRFDLRSAAGLIVSAALCVLHPLYYYLRWGVPTPQLLNGGISTEPPTFKRMATAIVDPEVGLLANWPLGVFLLVICFAALWFNREKAPRLERRFALFALLFTLVMAYFHSKTSNLNHGGTVSVSRYALWYLCLFFPPFAAGFLFLFNLPWAARAAWLVPVVALIWFNTKDYAPGLDEEYGHPTFVSARLYRYLPALWDPVPEVFRERNSGYGESPITDAAWAVSNRTCNKILLLRQNLQTRGAERLPAPLGCELFIIDMARLRAIASDYFALHRNEQAHYLDLSVHEAEKTLSAPALFSKVFDKPSARDVLGKGWSMPEPWGVWSDGTSAQLHFETADRDCGRRCRLTFVGQAFLGSWSLSDNMKVALNGNLLGTVRLESPVPARYELQFDPSLLRGTNLLELFFEKPWSPLAAGVSPDPRRLGIGLIRLSVEPMR